MENPTYATERFFSLLFSPYASSFLQLLPLRQEQGLPLAVHRGQYSKTVTLQLGHKKVALWSARNHCAGEWRFRSMAARHHACSASPNNLVRMYYL